MVERWKHDCSERPHDSAWTVDVFPNVLDPYVRVGNGDAIGMRVFYCPYCGTDADTLIWHCDTMPQSTRMVRVA